MPSPFQDAVQKIRSSKMHSRVAEAQLPWAVRTADLQSKIVAKQGLFCLHQPMLLGVPQSEKKAPTVAKLLILQGLAGKLMLSHISELLGPALLANPDAEWLQFAHMVRRPPRQTPKYAPEQACSFSSPTMPPLCTGIRV